ncbi:hypothetical protein GZ77_10320 [Endozoicomonas montiporae]|uniref:Uncharacterized protein n=2 Tax=Endozoicomonas montiporae TaxID=1027273 RepID=A0A081N8C5_9GAMM|nr:hypothetical protein [Endozoicomonas montiporae]AMO55412.1 hypothetical protein EZMO1_1219 [Endozoicomonas montiporae CL-33]KEQ14698.1 hypothetical protein GZ77_10320 [Endozoicomonas montiporae]
MSEFADCLNQWSLNTADKKQDKTGSLAVYSGKNGEQENLAMFNGIGPRPTDRGRLAPNHKLADGKAPKTSDYRDVQIVTPDLSKDETDPSPPTRQLHRRQVRPVYVKSAAMGSGPVLWQPTTRQAPHPVTKPLSDEQCAGLPKRTFVDRVMALAVCILLDMRSVRQKFVSYTSATAYAIKGQLQKLQQLLKRDDADLSEDERAESREMVKNLRKDVKQYKKAKLDEAHNYIQLVKALKKINRGQIDSHKVHLTGMELAGGRASLEDIDMTIKGVDVVSNASGDLVPQLKADIKATLVLPIPGKPPVRVSIDVEGAKLTLEGRIMPIVNSYIQGNMVEKLFKNIRHLWKNKEAKFQLSHFGLSAERVSARLDDVDPGAVSRIVARSKYGDRRAIKTILTQLKMPVDVQIDELEVFDQGQEQPMLKVDDISAHLKCRPIDNVQEGEEEARELGIQTGNIHLDTQHASDLGSQVVQKMVKAPLTIMPGDKGAASTVSAVLQEESGRLTGDINRSEIKFSMDCLHQKEGCKSIGHEQLDVWVDQLGVEKEGATRADIGISEVHLSMEKQGPDRSVTTKLHDFIGDVDLQKTYPDRELKLDVHGRVQGLDAELTVTKKDGKSDYHWEASDVDIKTTPGAMMYTKGALEVSLPGDGLISFSSLEFDSKAQVAGLNREFHLKGFSGAGNGDIRVKNQGSEWSIPVRGSGELHSLDLHTQKQSAGAQDIPETLTYAQQGALKLKDLGVSGVRLGEVATDIDEHGNGTIRLNRVELNGSELLKNAGILPENYQKWITPALVEGRIFRCDIALKVVDGKIISDDSEVSGLDIEHTEDSGKTLKGQAYGYVLGMLQGLVNRLDVSGMSVHEGRLWLELNLKGFCLPVPLFKVGSQHVNENGSVSITGLLHEKTGVQLMGMREHRRELIDRVNAGDQSSLEAFEEACKTAPRQETVGILQRTDIKGVLQKARTGDPQALANLPVFYQLFLRYPETVNRALQVREFIDTPAESLDDFTVEPYARKVDPVILFQCMQREGKPEKALHVMDQALARSPYNARLNYFSARLLDELLQSPFMMEKTDDERHFYQVKAGSLLARASRGGYSRASERLQEKAGNNDPYAILAQCGDTLTHTKDIHQFYKVLTQLEALAGHDQTDIRDCAKQILINRARNSDNMFLHPDQTQVKELDKQHSLISKKREDELSGIDTYRWGLRYLYGVDGVGADPVQAIRLLSLSKEKGIPAAEPHLHVMDQVAYPALAAAAA